MEMVPVFDIGPTATAFRCYDHSSSYDQPALGLFLRFQMTFRAYFESRHALWARFTGGAGVSLGNETRYESHPATMIPESKYFALTQGR